MAAVIAAAIAAVIVALMEAEAEVNIMNVAGAVAAEEKGGRPPQSKTWLILGIVLAMVTLAGIFALSITGFFHWYFRSPRERQRRLSISDNDKADMKSSQLADLLPPGFAKFQWDLAPNNRSMLSARSRPGAFATESNSSHYEAIQSISSREDTGTSFTLETNLMPSDPTSSDPCMVLELMLTHRLWLPMSPFVL